MVKVVRNGVLFAGMLLVGLVQASPEIEHWQTTNGARVYYVSSPELPMVDVRIVFDAGSARDEIEGTALMTNGMLSEGAAGDSAQVLAEKFEAVGAAFENGALKDMAWLGVRSLSDEQYLHPAIVNLKNILSRPDFPVTAYRRELERLKISVKAGMQSPGNIATLRFYKELYGDHPYARPSEGTEASLKKLALKDLKAFYKRYYVASNAVIAIVGAVDKTEAKRMAEELVSGLPSGERAPELPPVKLLTESRTVYIDFPSSQSTVLMGEVGMPRGDKDYFALYTANHAFGGSGFGSRLMNEVREKRGLAYSTYSYYSPMRVAGPLQIGLQTRNDQVDEALNIIHKELDRYVSKGLHPEELEDSLKNITGGFPLRIDSNKKIAEYLSVIGFYNLPLDYLDTMVTNFRQQTLPVVNDAIRRRIHPDQMLTVIVGARSSEKQKP